MEYIIGIIVGILALLGFKKVKLPPLPKELSDDRVEELEGKLDDLEKREKELKEDGAEELKPDQVEDYWNEKK